MKTTCDLCKWGKVEKVNYHCDKDNVLILLGDALDDELICSNFEAKKDVKTFQEIALQECSKVNLSNPQAVAEAIPEIVEALKSLVALLNSGDPVEVGCHCTDSGEGHVVCVWCKAKAVLQKAGVK